MKKLLIGLFALTSCKFINKEFPPSDPNKNIEQIQKYIYGAKIKKDTIEIIQLLLKQSEEFGKLKEIDKARNNINQAIKLANESKNEQGTAECLFELAKLEYKYGVPQIAELSFEKSKEIYKSRGTNIQLLEINTFGIKLYKYLGKEEKVLEIINESKQTNN